MEKSPDTPERSDEQKDDSDHGESVSGSSTKSNRTEKQSNTTNQEPDNANGTNNPTEVSMGWWKRKWEFIIEPKHSNAVVAIFSGLLFFATLAYIVFAGLQWNTMDKQLTEMRSSARPYITAIPPLYGEIPAANFHDISLTGRFANFGNSPAINVAFSEPIIAIDTDSGVKEQIKKCTFEYPTPNAELPPAAGSAQVGTTAKTVKTRFISDEERPFLFDHSEHVVLFGGVKYTSVQPGTAYETTYCWQWDPESITNHYFPWGTCSCQRMN
jgi:hypothetical protein